MAEVSFLNQVESFMSGSYISQLDSNAGKKTLGSNENKIQ